jgi:hypothetical protein
VIGAIFRGVRIDGHAADGIDRAMRGLRMLMTMVAMVVVVMIVIGVAHDNNPRCAVQGS